VAYVFKKKNISKREWDGWDYPRVARDVDELHDIYSMDLCPSTENVWETGR
jgi:hypothetical protein